MGWRSAVDDESGARMNSWTIIARSKKRMVRTLKRMRDYSFFRSLGHGIIEAWDKAGRTL
jgi:hypothetical protein